MGGNGPRVKPEKYAEIQFGANRVLRQQNPRWSPTIRAQESELVEIPERCSST